MSLEMRRRQEGSRKRGYLDTTTTLETADTNSYTNHSPKAYAVHDSSYEDLDRLIMFITESKQIQGRYYVRYLPGMMNTQGELTPCNYRPSFSFSPPTGGAPSSSTTPRFNNRSKNTPNNKAGLPDVVDLTEDEDMLLSQGVTPSKKNKGFLAGIRPYSDGRRVDRPDSGGNSSSDNNEGGIKKENNNRSYRSDDDDGDDEKSGQGSSSSSGGRNPSAGNPNKKKQTARKSMKARTEVRPTEIPEIKGSSSNSKSEEEADDQADHKDNNQHSISGKDNTKSKDSTKSKDTTKSSKDSKSRDTSISSAADGDPASKNKSEIKTKSSNKDDRTSSNNISSNKNTTPSSSSSKPNTKKPSQENNTNSDWNLDGITVTVNPDFG